MRHLLLLIMLLGLASLACNLTGSDDDESTLVPTIATQPISAATQAPVGGDAQVAPTSTPTTTVADNIDDEPVLLPNCTPRTEWRSYIVQSGDTLSIIASRFITDVDTLVTANCLANPDNIVAGQQLYVPVPAAGTVTQTYVDSVVGFAFDYPSDWHMQEPIGPRTDPYTVIFTSYNPDTAPGRGGVDADKCKVDVSVHRDEFNSLEELYQYIYRSSTGGASTGATIYEDYRFQLDSGLPAHRLTGDSIGEFRTLMVYINGRAVTATAFGNEFCLQHTVYSLRPN